MATTTPDNWSYVYVRAPAGFAGACIVSRSACLNGRTAYTPERPLIFDIYITTKVTIYSMYSHAPRDGRRRSPWRSVRDVNGAYPMAYPDAADRNMTYFIRDRSTAAPRTPGHYVETPYSIGITPDGSGKMSGKVKISPPTMLKHHRDITPCRPLSSGSLSPGLDNSTGNSTVTSTRQDSSTKLDSYSTDLDSYPAGSELDSAFNDPE